MKAPMVLAWTVIGLVGIGTGASIWQASRMDRAETAAVTTIPVRQTPNSDFKVVDLGLFKVQKVRDGRSVRFEILKVEIEVYKGVKVEKLEKLSPCLCEDLYVVLRKKMTRVSDTGRISFNSPKLKKKLMALARKRLGKSVVHDIKITDHQKTVRE